VKRKTDELVPQTKEKYFSCDEKKINSWSNQWIWGRKGKKENVTVRTKGWDCSEKIKHYFDWLLFFRVYPDSVLGQNRRGNL
jgi:hypothetical protein